MLDLKVLRGGIDADTKSEDYANLGSQVGDPASYRMKQYGRVIRQSSLECALPDCEMTPAG